MTASSQATGGQTYPFSNYTYNRAGALTSVTLGGSGASYVSAVTYAPHGGITQMNLGNGLTEATVYSPDLRSVGVLERRMKDASGRAGTVSSVPLRPSHFEVAMAFTVDWELDASESVSVESLLGDISLSDGRDTLAEKSVYLDSWIKALAEASRIAALGVTAFDVDIIEESRALHVRRDADGRIHVGFNGKEVTAESADAFTEAVRTAAHALLDRIRTIEGCDQNEALGKIRNFVSHG